MTLIWYWWSGRTVMTLPVMFHWLLSWFWIVSISPFCRRRDYMYTCYTSSLCIALMEVLLMVLCCSYPFMMWFVEDRLWKNGITNSAVEQDYAWDRPMPWIGVLQHCKMAWAMLLCNKCWVLGFLCCNLLSFL